MTRPRGIAARLLDLRARAGLQAKDIAASTGWHPSKVSRIENGRTAPSVADVRAWVKACGAGDEVADELERLLTEAQIEHRNWKLSMRRGQAEVQAKYNRLAQDARLIRHFEMTAVPGLLQTPEYARRMFVEMARLHDLEVRDLDAAVAQRMERQRLLYDTARRFEFLLAEPVLRWLVVPAAVMRGQLDRLQTAIGVPNIRFGILPLRVELSTVPQNSMVLYVSDETVAALETFTGETFHRGDEANVCSRALDWLWENAVTGDQARDLILQAARDLPPAAR